MSNAEGASSDPCNNIYRGMKPFSAPETRALRDYIMATRENIVSYLSFHSYGQYILLPWGFKPALPRDIASLVSSRITSIRND